MSFEYQDDNPLQPILVVEPPQGLAGKLFGWRTTTDIQIGSQQKPPVRSNYRIRILLAASNDLFPIQKTLPTEACVRKSTLDIHDQVPSPMYNATLRSECSSLASLKSLQHSLAQSDGFRDACVLGAVWLRQRGLGSSISKGGFGQFEWASVVSMLMQGGGRANRPVLSSRYSSYQLFKATLHFLAATDLSASPMIFHSTDLKFASSNHPVFFDGSRGLNLLFKMSPWSYEMVRRLSVTKSEHSLRSIASVRGEDFTQSF